jgi:hypothetical protein
MNREEVNNMQLIKALPFSSELDGDLMECVLWQSSDNLCEAKEEGHSACDTSGFYYGTLSDVEPKFCARHFYQEVVSGDGLTNYKLTDSKT